jgi:hypothetical protein
MSEGKSETVGIESDASSIVEELSTATGRPTSSLTTLNVDVGVGAGGIGRLEQLGPEHGLAGAVGVLWCGIPALAAWEPIIT